MTQASVTRRSIALLAVSLLASACGTVLAPSNGSEAGRYVATRFDSHALPTMTDSSAIEFGLLLADTLELDGRGAARRAFTVRRVGSARDTVYRVAIPMKYRVDGTAIQVGSLAPCPPNAICVGDDVGRFIRSGISLTAYMYGSGGTVLLERID